MQILGCVSEKPSGHRVSAFPMKDMAQGRSSAVSERQMDAPVSMRANWSHLSLSKKIRTSVDTVFVKRVWSKLLHLLHGQK